MIDLRVYVSVRLACSTNCPELAWQFVELSSNLSRVSVLVSAQLVHNQLQRRIFVACYVHGSESSIQAPLWAWSCLAVKRKGILLASLPRTMTWQDCSST